MVGLKNSSIHPSDLGVYNIPSYAYLSIILYVNLKNWNRCHNLEMTKQEITIKFIMICYVIQETKK